MPTSTPGLSSILSLGLKALEYDSRRKMIVKAPINQQDLNQYFKIVLISNGAFVLQHDDGCVGTDPEKKTLTVVKCTDYHKVLQLNKGNAGMPFFLPGELGPVDPLRFPWDSRTRAVLPETVNFVGGRGSYIPKHLR